MARRVKIGGEGGGERQEKALANVTVGGEGSTAQSAGGLLNFFQSDGEDRELDQEQALRSFYQSPPLHMAVSAIGRAVGEISYGWEDDQAPDDWSPASPNRWHQSAELFSIIAAYLKLAGEAVLIKKGPAKDGIELLPIPPHLIEAPDARKGKWQIDDSGLTLSESTYDRDELVVLQDPSLLDPFVEGRGSAQSVGADVDISDAGAEHTASFLENHARPDLLVTLNGASQKDLDNFRNSMRQKHGGAKNSGKIEAFQDAELSVEALNSSFEDLGLVELRKYSAEVVRQVFGIPPEVVGIVENSNRATIESADFLFKKTVIKPLVDKIVEGLNEQFIKVDLGEQYTLTTGAIVPEDRRFQADLMVDLPQAFTVDEARELAGADPMEGAEGQQTLAEAMPMQAKQATPATQPKGCGHEHGKKKRSRRADSSRRQTTNGFSAYSTPSARRT
jgi:HK97 family phage portal protein